MTKFLEKINIYVATLGTIISTIIAILVWVDHSQIEALKGIDEKAQDQISELKTETKILSDELTETRTNSIIISKEYNEVKNLDSGISLQTSKLSKQIKFSQEEQLDRKHAQDYVKKIEMLNLKNELQDIKNLYVDQNNKPEAYYSHLSFLNQAKGFLQKQSKFQILIEDSSIFFQWISLERNAEYFTYQFEKTINDTAELSIYCNRLWDVLPLESLDSVNLKRREKNISDCIKQEYSKQLIILNSEYHNFWVEFYDFINNKLSPYLKEKFIEYKLPSN